MSPAFDCRLLGDNDGQGPRTQQAAIRPLFDAFYASIVLSSGDTGSNKHDTAPSSSSRGPRLRGLCARGQREGRRGGAFGEPHRGLPPHPEPGGLDRRPSRQTGRAAPRPHRPGGSYCTELQRAFDLIGEATLELRRDAAGAGSIHLRCTPALAARFLLLRLPELQAHLGVADITLQPTSARPEINLGEADAEIAYLESAPSRLPAELRAEAFCRPRIVPVASAIFKAQHPQVRSIRDLLSLPLISEQSTQQWRAWFRACGVTETPRIAGPRLWHSSQSIEAVRLHQGVALVSELLLAPGPKEEAIVEMVRSSVRLGSYYFVARSQTWYQPRIRRLRTWIRKSFAEGLASPAAPRRAG